MLGSRFILAYPTCYLQLYVNNFQNYSIFIEVPNIEKCSLFFLSTAAVRFQFAHIVLHLYIYIYIYVILCMLYIYIYKRFVAQVCSGEVYIYNTNLYIQKNI